MKENHGNGNRKWGETMSEKEKKILETFARVIPEASEEQKNYLLGVGEGMILARKNQNKEKMQEVIWTKRK